HGAYRIGAVTPGTYLVKQDLPPSWAVRTSTPNGSAVVLGGQTAYAINFSDVKPGQGVDFNSDGVPDYVRLVRVGPGTVEVRLDIMDGAFVGRTQVVGTYDPAALRLAGVGDFNGDGHPDLLFENASTGELSYWQLHSGQYVRSQYLATLPAGWHVAAVGDLDGQGTADLVLRQDGSGQLLAWLMNQNVIT